MSHQCRIEFYFKADELAKLLKENPGAKGIIVSQEIQKEKPRGSEHYVNVTHIRARVDKGDGSLLKTAIAGDEFIDGCPFPPGCTS